MTKRWKPVMLLLSLTIAASSLTGCNKSPDQLQKEARAEGMKYLQEGNYEEAIKSFQEGLSHAVGKINDEEYDLCFLKAKALYLNGQKEEALAIYDNIIDYKENAYAYYFRGNYYFAENQEELALKDYAKAIELDDTNYDLYISIYDSLIGHNQKALAEEYLNKALNAEGKKACSDMLKGRIYYCLNDEKLALEYLKKADESGEDEACFYIAMIYMNASDSKAEDYFKKFLKTEYATSDRLFEMGEIFMKKGQYAQAVTYLEAAKGQKGSVDQQIIMRYLLLSYEKSGDFEAAKKLVKEYVKAYPKDDAVKREAIFLETR